MIINKKSGITLISLVITIIVLLILAGVSLSLVLGENGVLKQAQSATTEIRKAEEKEKIEMAVAAAISAGNGVLITNNLSSELSKVIEDGILGQETEKGWSYSTGDKNYKIDKEGKVEEFDSLLPLEYQQVEYIESTGSQYIITNLVSSNNVFEYTAEVCATESTGKGQQVLFGSTNGFNVTIKSKIYRATSKCITDIEISSNKYDEINLISNPISSEVILTINGVTKTGTYTNFIMNEKLGIFAFSDGLCKAKCRIKSLKISINEEEKANFIPCYSIATVTNADGKQCPSRTIGMYDLVEGKFYTNQGTGDDFIAGPEV